MKNMCAICGHKFSKKEAYEYHVRKQICTRISSNNSCGTKPKITLKNKGSIDDISSDKLSQIMQIVLKQENEIKLLREQQVLQKTPTVTIINNGNNNNSIYNIRVPPAFLTQYTYENIMKYDPTLLEMALTRHPANFIEYLILHTNCNPERPLYNSIQVTNMKSSCLKVSDGTRFITASKSKIIGQLIDNKRSILQEYVDQNGEKYGRLILKKYEDYLNYLDDDDHPRNMKTLENEIIIMLHNVTNLFNTDEWSQKLMKDILQLETEEDQ
jgi:hypothetical protein